MVLGTPAPAACPFCDRTDHVLLRNLGLHDEPPAYHATCRTCGADGPVASSMRTAAMLWNRHGVTPASRLYRLLCGPGEA